MSRRTTKMTLRNGKGPQNRGPLTGRGLGNCKVPAKKKVAKATTKNARPRLGRRLKSMFIRE